MSEVDNRSTSTDIWYFPGDFLSGFCCSQFQFLLVSGIFLFSVWVKQMDRKCLNMLTLCIVWMQTPSNATEAERWQVNLMLPLKKSLEQSNIHICLKCTFYCIFCILYSGVQHQCWLGVSFSKLFNILLETKIFHWLYLGLSWTTLWHLKLLYFCWELLFSFTFKCSLMFPLLDLGQWGNKVGVFPGHQRHSSGASSLRGQLWVTWRCGQTN